MLNYRLLTAPPDEVSTLALGMLQIIDPPDEALALPPEALSEDALSAAPDEALSEALSQAPPMLSDAPDEHDASTSMALTSLILMVAPLLQSTSTFPPFGAKIPDTTTAEPELTSTSLI